MTWRKMETGGVSVLSNGKSTQLALFGGDPVRGPEKTWPSWPVHDDRERTAVLEVLESGKWFFGERVRRFEREYAAFQDAQHCVSCTSGTTAA
ncbi:MAG TPA: DegT/DnrJ/EryC1/StrS aminotransferase family protein, partial [Candidatus Hydrogenedentes bacterium]|nr:DegT/DnrJ/EryC1/StrS aminotransferase family protein [Candidatus Hydrogenedentota bacterium]